MKVVLGLGNPGKRYQRTPHNLGFLVVDRVASDASVSLDRKKYSSLVAEWRCGAERVLLVKPQTFVNRSGEAVRSLFRYLPLAPEDLVVIHDELDFSFGRVRIRPKGSAGGHRGVRSVIESLGDENFLRVRVGIGRPPSGVDPTDYLLRPFSADQRLLLDEVILKAAEAVQSLLGEGLQRAMERINRTE